MVVRKPKEISIQTQLNTMKNEWLHSVDGQLVPFEYITNHYGFIYCIENNETGQRYVGRKFFTKASTRQKNGRKIKIRKSSGWEDYWGSGERLLADVEKLGKDAFRRTIIRLCKTKGECKYQETKLLFFLNVLEAKLSDGRPLYYNDNIAMKYTRKNIGL